MSGKILTIFFALLILIVGGGMYYMQVYYYYRDVTEIPATLQLAGPEGQSVQIPVRDYQGIYSVSSPLANRACFTTDPAEAQTATLYDKPTPLIPPRWFDCFDVAQLDDDIAAGRAKTYLVQKDIAPQIDAVLAVYPDGRAFEWRQTNEEAEEKRTID